MYFVSFGKESRCDHRREKIILGNLKHTELREWEAVARMVFPKEWSFSGQLVSAGWAVTLEFPTMLPSGETGELCVVS